VLHTCWHPPTLPAAELFNLFTTVMSRYRETLLAGKTRKQLNWETGITQHQRATWQDHRREHAYSVTAVNTPFAQQQWHMNTILGVIILNNSSQTHFTLLLLSRPAFFLFVILSFLSCEILGDLDIQELFSWDIWTLGKVSILCSRIKMSMNTRSKCPALCNNKEGRISHFPFHPLSSLRLLLLFLLLLVRYSTSWPTHVRLRHAYVACGYFEPESEWPDQEPRLQPINSTIRSETNWYSTVNVIPSVLNYRYTRASCFRKTE
jgi:hypothetical protein